MTPLYLQTVQDYPSAATGLVFSAMLLAGAVLQPFVGHLSDGIGRKPVLVVGNLVAAIAAAVIVLSDGGDLMLVGLVVAAGALTGIRSVVLAAAVDFAGGREATTLGLAFVLMDGVGALGAVLAGAVGSIDLVYAFALAAGLSALAAATALTLSFVARDAVDDLAD